MHKNILANKNDQLLQHYRALAVKWGMKPQDIRPVILKVYSRLKDNQKGVKFQLQEVNTSGVSTESLVKKSDVVFAHRMGLGIHKVLIDAANDNEQLPGNTPIHFYPDAQIFNGAVVNIATEAQSLQMLYQSKMTLKTDQDVRMEDYPTDGFRKVPGTQQGANTIPEQDGMPLVDLTTAFHIWGDRRNSVDLQFPDGDYAAIEGDTDAAINYGVLVYAGFVAVNAANNRRVIEYFHGTAK